MMKPLAESKSRLASRLPPERRALLSLGMLARVLQAALPKEGAGSEALTVVGGDEAVRGLSEALGAGFLPELASGLNESLREVLRQAAAEGWDASLYLPADLPLIGREDVEGLLAAGESGQIVLAPDRREKGTNALLLPCALAFEPAFGEGSFPRHLRQAEDLGGEPRVCRSAGLRLDVDTPADLAVLLERRPHWWEETEALVSSLALPAAATRAPPRSSPL